VPADEDKRLAALRALGILDTPPEERFDRITRLAKRLFGVPIALISLVDAQRQWFKSCQGLGIRQTARDISFCGHAILGQGPLVVPDALLDERFADNPLVLEEPRIRFYAGQPLRAADGSRVGVLCLQDHRPRSPGEEDLQLLRDLAALAEDHLSLIETSQLQREIQGHQRAEQRLGMQYAVTRTLAASATLAEAAPQVLQAIRESVGWDVGWLWSLDRTTNVLRCVECSHRPAAEVAEFEARSRQSAFSRGIGLPGRVWSSGKPAWIPDVTRDANFPRAAVAVQVGLHGAFGF